MRSPSEPLIHREKFRYVFAHLIGKQVCYVPMFGNVGDKLLNESAYQLMTYFGIAFSVYDGSIPNNTEELVFAAGGNLGTTYQHCYERRRELLQSGLPSTVLPQSCTDDNDNLPYTRVFVRELHSLQLRPDAVLAPDLALGFATDFRFPTPTINAGLWVRKDHERSHSSVGDGDPADVASTPLEYLLLASRYRHITTDRLHFAIAGLITGRSVTLLPNSYHKNISMYQTWLADLGCDWAIRPKYNRHRSAFP